MALNQPAPGDAVGLGECFKTSVHYVVNSHTSGLSERLVRRSRDAPRGIRVGPPERLGGLVVLLDVSHRRPLAAL